MQTYSANGKILLTGEYFILDGALGLALPTPRYCQTLNVQKNNENGVLTWLANDEIDENWLNVKIQLTDFQILSSNNTVIAATLHDILKEVKNLNTNFLNDTNTGWHAQTNINFPRNWGLGTSSTLTYLIAEWAGINAFALNDLTFKSSGYDVACAKYDAPIFYQKNTETQEIHIRNADFQTPVQPFNFTENLYFVHLGQKQNSRDGIAFYKKLPLPIRKHTAESISKISAAAANATTLTDFEKILTEHENIVAQTLHLSRAQSLYFNDFWGVIKSLGAWGGDFVLATSCRSKAETLAYFTQKGFTTVLQYRDFIG